LAGSGDEVGLIVLQIDVAVNAPEAGTIKEFLANEEDTVTVGQDLVRLELGGAPAGGEKGAGSAEPKEAASSEQPTSSDPEPSKREDSAAPKEEKKSTPPPQEQPKKESPPPKQPDSKKSEPKAAPPALGNREERRVSRRSHVPDSTANNVNRLK
jgi:2-oxoglutarate dehydrogenase E2 component (dihydrolipoamide succinyltransferase)